MSGNRFTVEELVLDEYFRKWVQGNLPSEDTYWDTWVAENTDQKELADRARLVVEALNMDHDLLGERRVAESVKGIVAKIEREEGRERAKIHFLSYSRKIAAAFILGVGLLWYFVKTTGDAETSYETMVDAVGTKTIEKINNANHPLTIVLSDGSSITLQPGSKLSYPEEFAADKREVILLGEGFFDIARQPGRPFLVYANEIVTKVLGTSFHIRAYENDTDVTVKVVTGKVSVLAPKADKVTNRANAKGEGVILTPNQMAVYARNPEKLTRSLVENPGIIKTSAKKSSDYNFEDAPVTQVFQALEEGYGVPIVYNAEQLAPCTVTAPLENETLYEKLDMICKVIRAGYEIVDAQVIITSKGCE